MKYILYALMLVLAISIQAVGIQIISFKGIVPDLTVIVLFYFALREGRRSATLLGFLLGLFLDIISTAPLGTRAFIHAIVGFMAGSILGQRSLLHYYEAVGYFTLLYLFYSVITHWVLFGFSGFISACYHQLLPALGYQVIVLIVFFLLIPPSMWQGRYIRKKPFTD